MGFGYMYGLSFAIIIAYICNIGRCLTFVNHKNEKKWQQFVWVSVFGIPLQRFKDNAVRRVFLDDSILFII